ncbi:undecaprenyl-diphosphate phosphatase [Sphingomonas sp. RB3P16]|uniref:undecaprenyl-diphosphate phosphatase n=1 Tax=Parasphingomonas frigoris TaxID=3096163 RepID=UPI002FC84274
MGDIISIILLGIVEGVTEFLPVSSTGHLILATKLLGYEASRWEVFNIVIQLGAILAIVVLYWRTFWAVGMGLLRLNPVSLRFVRNILVAFTPAAIVGLAIHKQIEALLGNAVVVSVALVIGGIAIIVVERLAPKGDIAGVADIPLAKVVGIGCLQCLAMVPGVSRSGATILGALALGVERRTAAEFSFFLAIPTMLGATTLELVKNRHELLSGQGVGLGAIGLGFIVAFVVALLVVKWFVGVVTRFGFEPFAWYRIVAGSAALIWLLSI